MRLKHGQPFSSRASKYRAYTRLRTYDQSQISIASDVCYNTIVVVLSFTKIASLSGCFWTNLERRNITRDTLRAHARESCRSPCFLGLYD